MKLNDITNLDTIRAIESAGELFQNKKYQSKDYLEKFLGLMIHRSGFYGRLIGDEILPLERINTAFNELDDVCILIEGVVNLSKSPVNIGLGGIVYIGNGTLEVDNEVVYNGRGSSGDVGEEPFSEEIIFNGDRIQVHNQSGDILIDLADTGHSEGSSTLIQEIIGGGQLLNLSSKLLDKLKGENLNSLKKNKLFYIHDSRLSGDVYGRTEVTNYVSDLTAPLIISASVSDVDRDQLTVEFEANVDASIFLNTTLNFSAGSIKNILSLSGSGTATLVYQLDADIEQSDEFSIVFTSPTDVTSSSTGEPLLTPTSFAVTNQVVNDSFPANASWLRRWESYSGLNSDNNAGFASSWVDIINSSVLSASAPTKEPSINVNNADFNNKPSLNFDSFDDFLEDNTLDLSGTDKVTIYVVAKERNVNQTPSDTYRTMFSYGNGVSQQGSFYARDVATQPDYRLFFDGDPFSHNSRVPANLDGNNNEIGVFKFEIDTTKAGYDDVSIQLNGVDETVSAGQPGDNTGNLGNYNFQLGAWAGSRFGDQEVVAVYIANTVFDSNVDTIDADVKSHILSTYGV